MSLSIHNIVQYDGTNWKTTAGNANSSGAYIYTGSPHTITINTTGVDELIDFPSGSSIIGQNPNNAALDPVISSDGILTYNATDTRTYFLSFIVHARTTNALVSQVLKVTLYLNGSPFNGGQINSSSLCDNSEPCSIMVPLNGGQLANGDEISLYIANMSGTDDVEVYATSLIGTMSAVN